MAEAEKVNVFNNVPLFLFWALISISCPLYSCSFALKISSSLAPLGSLHTTVFFTPSVVGLFCYRYLPANLPHVLAL
jgi:hypothetical protein